MIDTKLIADSLNKCAGQQHLVANHCTCYQGNMARYQSDSSDLVSRSEAEYHERVLRSFLVTGCIRTSVNIVREAVEMGTQSYDIVHYENSW